jgi:pimeloyl-ACP methyl ester carboxylesterase
MIAAMYAAARSDCAAAVNIDGHAAGPDDRLLGMAPAVVRDRWAEVIAVNVRILPGGGVPVEENDLPAIRKAMTDMWITLGVPPDMESAALDRAMHRLDDGRLLFRPSAASARPMLDQTFDLDLFGIYRRLTCPLLIFNGVGAEPADMPGPPWWREFIAAHHEAVRAGLDSVAVENPYVDVETVDDTHYLFVKQPEATAQRIRTFIARAVPSAAD